MGTVGMEAITYNEWAKRLGPNNQTAKIVEILEQENQILKDAMWLEANNITSHRTTIRTGLPKASWRLLNRGVPRGKSRTTQVDFSTGILETWSVVDSALANLNGNRASFMLSEHTAFLEGMNQEFAQTLFYGNLKSNKAAFPGLATYYSTLDPAKAESAKNVIDAGGTGNDLTSAWFVDWGDNTIHMIHPKGIPAGLQRKDFGEMPVQDEDGNEYKGLKTNYSWTAGLVVRDWRYVVRIANIPAGKLNDLVTDGAGSASAQSLVRCLIKGYNCIPNPQRGRLALYMNRTVKTMLDLMAAEKSNVNLTIKNFEGEEVTSFKGVPIRQCDAILDTEDQVAA